MLNKARTMKPLDQVELAKRTLVKWDGRGTKLSGVTNIELKFGIHVIAHKIYSSSWLNNVSCEAVNLEYKVV